MCSYVKVTQVTKNMGLFLFQFGARLLSGFSSDTLLVEQLLASEQLGRLEPSRSAIIRKSLGF